MVWDVVASVAITLLISLIIAFKYWSKVKAKIHAITEALIEVDKAVYDDKITEEEFRAIFEKFKNVVKDP